MKFSHLRFFSELTNEQRNVKARLNFALISTDLSIYLHSHAWHIASAAMHFIQTLASVEGRDVKYYSKSF